MALTARLAPLQSRGFLHRQVRRARHSEAARRAGVGYIHWGHLCQFETERLVAPDAARTAGLAPESFTGGR